MSMRFLNVGRVRIFIQVPMICGRAEINEIISNADFQMMQTFPTINIENVIHYLVDGWSTIRIIHGIYQANYDYLLILISSQRDTVVR